MESAAVRAADSMLSSTADETAAVCSAARNVEQLERRAKFESCMEW
jgi:hypothetical protein